METDRSSFLVDGYVEGTAQRTQVPKREWLGTRYATVGYTTKIVITDETVYIATPASFTNNAIGYTIKDVDKEMLYKSVNEADAACDNCTLRSVCSPRQKIFRFPPHEEFGSPIWMPVVLGRRLTDYNCLLTGGSLRATGHLEEFPERIVTEEL